MINEFLKKQKELDKDKVITYPLLGEQEIYKDVLSEFEFKFIPQAIMKFEFTNPSNIAKLGNSYEKEISDEYNILNWDAKYINQVIKLVYDNFKNSNDALFDPRFRTYGGSKDIVKRIVNSVYGQFLPQYSKIIIKNKKVIGVCFVNVTGKTLINIPLVTVDKNERGNGFGNQMVLKSVKQIVDDALNQNFDYTEINVTADLTNISAIKMYEYCGFIKDYEYQQSYKN